MLVAQQLINVVYFPKGLPSFGPYKKKRLEIVAKYKETADLLSDSNKPEKVRPAVKPTKPTPSVKVGKCSVILNTHVKKYGYIIAFKLSMKF